MITNTEQSNWISRIVWAKTDEDTLALVKLYREWEQANRDALIFPSEEEYAKFIQDGINNMSFHTKQAAEQMVRVHPTIRQSIMRLFVQFMREMAKIECPDVRDSDSVELAKELVAYMELEKLGSLRHV